MINNIGIIFVGKVLKLEVRRNIERGGLSVVNNSSFIEDDNKKGIVNKEVSSEEIDVFQN